MSETPIISGALQDLDLSMVMDVTCLGRQTLRLEVSSASGAMIGFVVLKAGHIIAAEAGTHRGPDALAVILNADAHAQFRVVRDATDAKAAAAFAKVGEPLDFSRSTSGLFAEGTKPKIRVMEGSLSEFDVPTLLQTIGMGRTYVEVDVLSESGQTIGAVILKSGKIVSARAGSFEGLQAVRELIDSPKHFQFAVFRVDEQVSKALQNVPPVGGLGQVLMEAQPRAHRPTRPLEMKGAADRTTVMSGLLSEFDVPTLLQTLGSGRQYVGLEIHHNGSIVGQIMVKAGMVITARAGELAGVPAFRKLVQSPAAYGFHVFRSSAAIPNEEPLGPLHRLLMAAMEPVAQPTADRTTVITGTLADFGIQALLESLSQNRQHSLIELRRGNHLLGTLHVKAGMVCDAQAGTQAGIAAFRALLAAPSDSDFSVFRLHGVNAVTKPLGALNDLLHEKIESGAEAWTPHAGQGSAETPIVEEAARAKRGGGMWIGLGIGIAAVVAAAVFMLRPGQPMDVPTDTPEVSMAVDTTAPPTRPLAPVQEAKPDEPVPPVQEAKPVPPVQEATPVPPVQEAKPVPPVQEAKPVTRPPAATTARRMTTHTVQSILAKLGYPVGAIDNIYGRKTKAALTAFQTAEGLEATGTLNAATIRALAAK